MCSMPAAYLTILGMTRPIDDLQRAKVLIDSGMSQAEAARLLGIPRGTIRTWVRNGFARKQRPASSCRCGHPCPHISGMAHNPAYAYLLGLYLGDGYIAPQPHGGHRLRVTLDLKYPGIILECRRAMLGVHAGSVTEAMKVGCLDVTSAWCHWTCVFPQHGPGPKHTRPIILAPWQRSVAIDHYPHLLLRGLIHSDGCRVVNTVKTRGKVYAYSRYHFSNRSTDIHQIFADACAAVGVVTRFNNQWNQSIVRRADAKRMDLFVGEKF